MRRGALLGSYFNSQPREGGWLLLVFRLVSLRHFNSQPREGGWWTCWRMSRWAFLFQLTAARRRLESRSFRLPAMKSFQLTAARRRLVFPDFAENIKGLFQLTAARRRLEPYFIYVGGAEIFQLTAARRRLALPNRYHKQSASISTHSRAKAAGQFTITGLCCLPDFNSQPREGGWLVRPCMRLRLRISTHSRAKAAGCRRCGVGGVAC